MQHEHDTAQPRVRPVVSAADRAAELLAGRILHILVLAAGLAFASASAQAATRYVAGGGADTGGCSTVAQPCATIGYAITQALPGDTIAIAAGTYTEPGGLRIYQSLRLQGAGEESTIIQAQAEPGLATGQVVAVCLPVLLCTGTPQIDVADLTIRHGVATQGSGTGGAGGGLFVERANLTATRVAFRDNVARTGGGLFVRYGATRLEQVRFTSNRAAGGGGMYGGEDAVLQFSDVTFDGNTADGTDGGGYGGGLYNAAASAVFDNVRFNANTATNTGGGLFNIGGAPQLRQVSFTGNRATGAPGHGGAIGNSTSSPSLIAVRIIGNQAAGFGGGVYSFNNSAPVFADVLLRGNSASSGGGMASHLDSTPSLSVVSLEANTAEIYGGAIYLDGGSTTLDDVRLIGNHADAAGGGITVVGGRATLRNAVVAGNTTPSSAIHHGGGVYLRDGASATLVNALLHGNTAGVGGGLLADEGTTLTLINSTVTGNAASFSLGGGLMNAGAAHLLNTVIWGNTAPTAGNDIHCIEPGWTSLRYSLYGGGMEDVTGGDCFEAAFSLTADPRLADAANGDFRLLKGSPAVNAGDPATDPAVFPTDGQGTPIDLDRGPRIAGPAIDIGAYESALDTPTAPVLAFDPATLDFGAVGVGITSPPRTVTLRNHGTADATNLAFVVSGDGFAADTTGCGNRLVRGTECTVQVRLTPAVTGAAAGQLAVASAEDAPAVLALAGNGVELPPQIVVEPGSYTLAVAQDEVIERGLTIRNVGNAPLDWTITPVQPAARPAGRGALADCEAEPGLLRHDDGTFELGFPSIRSAVVVDHFVPASYPAQLKAVCIALMSEGVGSIGLELVVLADDGPGGTPGTELGALAVSADDLPPPPANFTPAWRAYDLSPLGLSIPSGGVYIGVRWTQMQTSVYLAIDASPPNPPGYAGGYARPAPGQDWMPLQSMYPTYRSLFVRAVMAGAGACDAAAPVDWLAVEPAAGSTPGPGSSPVTLRFDARGLALGSYQTRLCIASNAPAQPATTVPVTMTVTGPLPRSLAALGGSGQLAPVGMPFALPLAVQVRDGHGRPLADVPVHFTAPAAGPGATLSMAVATTNAEGYAAVQATANAEVGDYLVTARVDGLDATATFSLGNRAAAVDVAVGIVAVRDHVRPGQMLDYLVQLSNAGPDAAYGASIASALPPELDLPFATWACLGPVASGCTEAGSGNLTDAGLHLLAGGAVSYLVSAPVRLDADGHVVTAVVAAAPGDGHAANDTAEASTPVVLHRDGFEVYGTGAGGPLLPLADARVPAYRRLLDWRALDGNAVETVLLARAADGSGFRLERLAVGSIQQVRLVGIGAHGGEYAGAWAPLAGGRAELIVGAPAGPDGDAGATAAVSLHGPGLALSLPLDGATIAYRVWVNPATRIEGE